MKKREDDNFVIAGFIHPDYLAGFTRLPHFLIWHMGNMSEPELRVVLYIFRHTWGFSKDKDEGGLPRKKHITIQEFMTGRVYKRGKNKGKRMDHGTGLSDRGVKNGLEQALKHGFIIREVDDSDKGRVKIYYGINTYFPLEEEEDEPEEDDEEA